MLKMITLPSHEIDIQRYLNSSGLKDDSRNHTVPLLDSFPDPLDPQKVIAVLPLLRSIEEPPPASVRECVDFVQQSIEVCLVDNAFRWLLSRASL